MSCVVIKIVKEFWNIFNFFSFVSRSSLLSKEGKREMAKALNGAFGYLVAMLEALSSLELVDFGEYKKGTKEESAKATLKTVLQASPHLNSFAPVTSAKQFANRKYLVGMVAMMCSMQEHEKLTGAPEKLKSVPAAPLDSSATQPAGLGGDLCCSSAHHSVPRNLGLTSCCDLETAGYSIHTQGSVVLHLGDRLAKWMALPGDASLHAALLRAGLPLRQKQDNLTLSSGSRLVPAGQAGQAGLRGVSLFTPLRAGVLSDLLKELEEMEKSLRSVTLRHGGDNQTRFVSSQSSVEQEGCQFLDRLNEDPAKPEGALYRDKLSATNASFYSVDSSIS